ncbi:MAG: O-antigen ligase family protein, partial [Desulfuromonadaceae bacterium]
KTTGQLLLFCGFLFIIISMPINHTNAIKSAGYFLILIGFFIDVFQTRSFQIRSNPLLFPALILVSAILFSLFTTNNPLLTLSKIRSQCFVPITLFFITSFFAKDLRFTKVVVVFLLIVNIAIILFYDIFFITNNGNIRFIINFIATKKFISNGLAPSSCYFLFASIFSYIYFTIAKSIRAAILTFILLLSNIFFLILSNQRAALVGIVCAFAVSVTVFKKMTGQKAKLALLSLAILSSLLILATPLKNILIHEDWSKLIKLQFSSEYQKNDSAQFRITIQKYFWGYLKDHPFEGVGFGRKNLDYISEEELPDKPVPLSHAHNVLFHMALQTGVQGAMALLFLVFMQFRLLWKGIKKAGTRWDQFILVGTFLYMVGIWIRFQLDDVFRYGPLLTYWIVTGIATGVYMRSTEEKSPSSSTPC